MRVSLSVLLFALMGTMLSACAGSARPSEEPVIITFVALPHTSLLDRSADYEQLAESFHEANPCVGSTF
jgi:hypothetical protein